MTYDELYAQHRALSAKYLAECHRNRSDRVQLTLNKKAVRAVVADLQHLVIQYIQYDYDPIFSHNVEVLGRNIRDLRNLL